ncbi:MAG: LLM class flavin-dependent oxidoreductase [Proteobacteria bacterium]|nr:LLM class flavin-dependent oxidoreductase [Pseudomonadota bacterium]
MLYDVFFSISQTPVDGHTPTEATMYGNFLSQVQAADELGFGTGWIAESHLSSEVQKGNKRPVIPHWKGEVGLNADFLQLAHATFAKTKRIELGSAVMNILCMGGPVAHAERVSVFAALHGLDPEEARRIHVGFAAGRFQFMNEASGIVPRDGVEQAAWPAMKGLIFREASEIFLRLLRGDTFGSDDVAGTWLTRANFRSDEDWARVQQAAVERDGGSVQERIEVERRWAFEPLKIVPQQWRQELVQTIVGSHEPAIQDFVNTIRPTQVFNLSITQGDVIEATHRRMAGSYHPDGGPWQRSHMPRTTFVFLNERPGLSPAERSRAAREEAEAALGAYWTALQGTLDPRKVAKAANNALIGNADEVADQMVEGFHADDRLMLWFDFFNHDNDRVIANMEDFMNVVAPNVAAKLGR